MKDIKLDDQKHKINEEDIQEKDPIDIVDEKSLKNVLIRFLKGILIGIGAILPGLSGGVLAVIFGIYEPAIKFLGNLKHKFLKNVRFFMPAGIGLLVGIFLFSIVVEKAFASYLSVFACLFIGFVIGTIPSLWKTAGKKGRTKSDISITVIVAVAIFSLMLFGNKFNINVEPSILVWFLSGMLIALGFVVPGLSPSNFLIYFGLYDKMAGGIKDLNLQVILPLTIGAIISILMFSKLVATLFEKQYSKSHHSIVGLVIGSSLAIFPTVIIPEMVQMKESVEPKIFTLTIIASVVLFVVGGIVTYYFSKLEEKTEQNK